MLLLVTTLALADTGAPADPWSALVALASSSPVVGMAVALVWGAKLLAPALLRLAVVAETGIRVRVELGPEDRALVARAVDALEDASTAGSRRAPRALRDASVRP